MIYLLNNEFSVPKLTMDIRVNDNNSVPDKIQISRLEFHNQLWETSARALAKEFGISDAKIGLICKKYEIPKPPPGYKTRLETGHKDPVAALLPHTDPSLEQIEIFKNKYNHINQIFSDDINALLLKEDQPEYIINVPHEVLKISSSLSEVKKQLQNPGYQQNGLIWVKHEDIALKISKKNIERAMNILMELTSAFEKRKYKLEKRDNIYGGNNGHDDRRYFLTVNINGIQLDFKFRERLFQKSIQKLDEISDPVIRESYRWSFRPGKPVLLPSGLLYFEVETYTDNRCQKLWTDRKDLLLENQLNDFIKGLIIISEETRLRNIRWDEEKKIRETKEEEKRQKIAAEKAYQERMNAIRQLANEVLTYERVIHLKEKLENNINSEFESEKVIELKRWVNEYLTSCEPVKLFLKNQVNI